MARRRPRHGKPLLVIGAGAVSVSMVGCPITSANLVAFPPQACAPADDINLWLSAFTSDSGGGTLTLTLSLNTFAETGVGLADEFVADGGTVTGRQFDGAGLAVSTSVNVSIVPDAGAAEVVVHSGATCDAAARAVDIRIDVASLRTTLETP